VVLNTVTEFMESYIHIDSISIDLAESTRKRDAGKCEHFSIRYVGLMLHILSVLLILS